MVIIDNIDNDFGTSIGNSGDGDGIDKNIIIKDEDVEEGDDGEDILKKKYETNVGS